MSDEADESGLTDGSEYDGRYAFDRRKLLSGLGTVGAMAIAGCSGGSPDTTTTGTGTGTAAETATDTTTATETMQETETPDDGGMDSEIDARFGYISTGGQSLPVEPDHTIELNIQPQQDREIPEFFFEPVGLKIEPGDTVQFNLTTPHHNVNAYHPAFGYTQRVPDDVAPFSSPVLTAGDSWLYTFEQEGVHDFMCAPHEIFGMVGRLVVGSATGPGSKPVGEAPGGPRARPPEFTAALVYNDPKMDPDTIASQGSVSWSELADDSKRLTVVPAEQGGESGSGSGETTATPTPMPEN